MSDLDGRCFVRKGSVLMPADFAAEEMLNSLPQGREVLVTVRRPRSPQHHRWFFAMLRKVVENSDDRWGDEDDLLDDLKFAVGHVKRRVHMLSGEIVMVAQSISFAAMGEDKFIRFRDRCLYVIRKATGIDPEELMKEVDETQKPVGVASPPTTPGKRAPAQEREREPV